MTVAYTDGDVTLYHADCLEVLRQLPAASVDALVTDPPAGISFMGRTWDHDHGGRQGWVTAFAAIFRECLRVLKPGAHGLVWAIPRTSHWTATALEDAGFEVRDVITHLFATGFPKGWNFDNRYKDWCECEATTDLRELRNAVHPQQPSGAQQGAILLDDMLREVAVSGPDHPHTDGGDGREHAGSQRDASLRLEELGLEGRALHRAGEGLRDGAVPGASESEAERLRAGTHLGRRGDAGATADGDGGSPPPEPESGGQQAGEPAGLRDAPRALVDGALRDGGRCPRCGKLSQDFHGFDVAVKPASEHWILVRKPLSEPNVAANVLAHGTGALNVDGCRVASVDSLARPINEANNAVYGAYKQFGNPVEPPGRWPANLVLSHAEGCRQVGTRRVQGTVGGSRGAGGQHGAYSPLSAQPDQKHLGYADLNGTETVEAWECAPGCPVAELDRQSGERLGFSSQTDRQSSRGRNQVYGVNCGGAEAGFRIGFNDSGGASRFFYVAKADTAERNQGLYGFDTYEEVSIWVGEALAARLQVDTEPSPPRATAASTTRSNVATEWSMTLFGNESEAPSLSVWKSTIEMRTSSTTQSRTLNWLTTSLTSGSTEAASFEMANGGSPAASVETGIPSLTITVGETASLPGAGPVASGTRLRIAVEGVKRQPRRSTHPTVKPVDLMRWLCRLVTPPGGLVLDPFMGSGSTGVAAKLEGFRFIGIDQDPESVEVAKRRLGWAVHEPELFPPPR
jgi:DNA methylase